MAGIATIGAVGTAYLTVCESHINNPNAATSNDPYAITTTSGAAEMVLAQHLKQTEAKFYGAFWCPHCHDQKQLFGQEAVAQSNEHYSLFN